MYVNLKKKICVLCLWRNRSQEEGGVKKKFYIERFSQKTIEDPKEQLA